MTCKYINARVNDINVEFEADSGSDLNLFSRNYFQQFCNKLQRKPKLIKDDATIYAANDTTINSIGYFYAHISNSFKSIKSKIYVMSQENNDAPLMSRYDLHTLGYIKIDKNGIFAAKKISETNDISEEELKTELAAIHKEFASVFRGVGTYLFHTVDLKVKEDTEPFIMKAIPCPIHLRPKAIKRLQEFVKLGILEPVENGYPVQYCSPLLVILKPNREDIRLVCNFRKLNSVLIRSRYVPSVRLDDFRRISRGFKWFFKMDCKDAFHQLRLSKRSQDLTIISTFNGLYRWLKMPQGLNVSQDHWDHVMTSVLSNCSSTISNRDDLLGGGKTKREMLDEYKKVLTALKKAGITCDPAKNQVGLKSVTFFGMTFDGTGMSPDPKKVLMITQATQPQSKDELNSYICMAAWNECFIYAYARIVRPLRDLVTSKDPFKFEEIHVKAFAEVKDKLAKCTLNHHFEETRKTFLFTDAGKNAHDPNNKFCGFAAILSQKCEKTGKLLTIAYASRSISPTERSWSQCELESRALRFGVDKWRHYFIGIEILYCVVDCKALISLWNNHTGLCPPRIDRQRLATQDIPMQLIHLEGRNHPADYGSRQRIKENDLSAENIQDMEVSDEIDIYLVKQIKTWDGSDEATNKPIAIDRIRELTKQDKVLQFVKQRVIRKDWDRHKKDPFISPFYPVRHELSEIDNLLVRGSSQIVLPEKLQEYAVKLTHNLAHFGQNNTENLLFTRFYFPGYSTKVRKYVLDCNTCKHVNSDKRKEPSGMSPTPTKCFEVISCDFKGPLHDGTYIHAFLDQFSKYPEIYFTKSESFEAVKPHFTSFFSTHGYPRALKSDNGSPYQSHAFKTFLDERGIKHIPSIPESPWSNGEIENFMRVLRKSYDIARLKKYNYKEFLKQVIMVKRATPHPTTKVSPHFCVTGKQLDPGIIQGKLPFEEQSGISSEVRNSVRDNLIASKEQNVRRHNEKKNTVHLELKVGDTVLVRLGQNKRPETDHFLVTNVKGTEITATNKRTGRELKRHLNRFVKLTEEPETEKVHSEENRNDVRPHLLVVEPPPVNVPQGAQGDLNVGEDRDRRRNDEDRAPAENQQPSPRTTRRSTRESGVPIPEFPNVQPTTLERSNREQAAATEIMNQFRRQTVDSLIRRRDENRQN